MFFRTSKITKTRTKFRIHNRHLSLFLVANASTHTSECSRQVTQYLWVDDTVSRFANLTFYQSGPKLLQIYCRCAFLVSKAFTIKQKLAKGEKVRSQYYMLVWMCHSCKIPTKSLLYDKKDKQTFCNEDTVSSGWIFGQKHFRKHPVTFWHSKLGNKVWLIRYVWSKMNFNFDIVSRSLKINRKNDDIIFPLPGNAKNTFIIVTTN